VSLLVITHNRLTAVFQVNLDFTISKDHLWFQVYLRHCLVPVMRISLNLCCETSIKDGSCRDTNSVSRQVQFVQLNVADSV